MGGPEDPSGDDGLVRAPDATPEEVVYRRLLPERPLFGRPPPGTRRVLSRGWLRFWPWTADLDGDSAAGERPGASPDAGGGGDS